MPLRVGAWTRRPFPSEQEAEGTGSIPLPVPHTYVSAGSAVPVNGIQSLFTQEKGRPDACCGQRGAGEDGDGGIQSPGVEKGELGTRGKAVANRGEEGYNKENSLGGLSMLWLFPAGAAVVVLLSLFCFYIIYYSPRKKTRDPETVSTPDGAVYDPYREDMVRWVLETRRMPQEDVAIRSFDGLTLRGKYYEYAPGAPVQLMFHGYRGTGERDLCGGVQRCFRLGHSALIVDQRGCGNSEGRVITFGAKESRDCLRWVDFAIEKFGPGVEIILCGISMGAATVTVAAGQPLPEQVVGVLADCGFTSARDIIEKVMGQLRLPVRLLSPFAALGARLFGGFDWRDASPVEALKSCRVPVLFFHGEADDYVPCQMSRRNFEACAGKKMLVTVPGAGHGLSYVVDKERYLEAMRAFFGPGAPASGRGEGMQEAVKGE